MHILITKKAEENLKGGVPRTSQDLSLGVLKLETYDWPRVAFKCLRVFACEDSVARPN